MMRTDEHVDGNAVGGLLNEILGGEMTGQRGCCANCGAISYLGAVIAYRRAPGDVLRCPACDAVLMVIVSTPSGLRVGIRSLAWLELPV